MSGKVLLALKDIAIKRISTQPVSTFAEEKGVTPFTQIG